MIASAMEEPHTCSSLAAENAALSTSTAIMYILSIHHSRNANDDNEGSLLRPRRTGEPEANVIAPVADTDATASGRTAQARRLAHPTASNDTR